MNWRRGRNSSSIQFVQQSVTNAGCPDPGVVRSPVSWPHCFVSSDQRSRGWWRTMHQDAGDNIPQSPDTDIRGLYPWPSPGPGRRHVSWLSLHHVCHWMPSFDKISFQRSLIDCLSMTLFPASINFYICYLFIPTIIRQRNIILNSPWGVSYSFQCFQSQESWIFDILMLCSAHITWYPHPTQHGAVISLSRGWR